MPEENNRTNKTAESSVAAAAKTGKAVANIAKGAATGGKVGAALAAAKSSQKLIIPIVALLLVPVLIVVMLPSVIFGKLFSDGSDKKSGIADEAAFTSNMLELNDTISHVLSEGLNETLREIDQDFAASGCDDYEIDNPYGSDVRFNANYFISLYCAGKDKDIDSISCEDLKEIIEAHKEQLYSFTYKDETRYADGGIDEETGEPIVIEYTVRCYTIRYNGEIHFANEVFRLNDDQKRLATNYAQNLSVLLHDGCYQVLSATEFSSLGYSYDGVAFTDGKVQVVYYNQGDPRWADLPYGTDNIKGYACGPTAMAMVVSSLTSYTIDPANMSQWSYEHGHWCSGNGSYETLITGACKEWGLNVELCQRDEPERIKSALRQGKLIVAIMGPGHFTKGGHFIVLRGITDDGKILVADPASYTRSQQEWDLEIITDECSQYSLLSAPFNNLTSTERYFGTSAVCCPHFVGFDTNTTVAFLTEGVMKADIAHCLSAELGRPNAFIGLTGVANINQFLRALEELNEFGIKKIMVAFDMDALTNENVMAARERVITTGSEAGFEMTPNWWNPSCKGIDDLLLSVKERKQITRLL